mgnify:CR=1 FL=1
MNTAATGRLGRRYRVIWDQNSGQAGYYNPPLSPEQVAQAHFGFFAGRPVDAYVGAPGCNAGYTLAWPTEVQVVGVVDSVEDGGIDGWWGLYCE